MPERHDEQTERERALPDHETREKDERDEATLTDPSSSELDEASIEPHGATRPLNPARR
jgi:hypothetical protein